MAKARFETDDEGVEPWDPRARLKKRGERKGPTPEGDVLAAMYHSEAIKEIYHGLSSRLDAHLAHTKAAYGNLLQPGDVNYLTTHVNEAKEHLHNFYLSAQRGGSNAGEHLNNAHRVIDGIANDWAHSYAGVNSGRPNQGDPTPGPAWKSDRVFDSETPNGEAYEHLWDSIADDVPDMKRRYALGERQVQAAETRFATAGRGFHITPRTGNYE